MFWVIVCVIVIICLAGLALFEVEQLRHKRLEKKLKVELVNLGNIDCRFQLRAEEVTGALSFQFLQNGTRLSEWVEGNGTAQPAEGSIRVTPRAQAPGGAAAPQTAPIAGKTQGAMKTGSVFASLLTSLGAILPGAAGDSLLRTGTEMQQTESKVVRIQQVADQAAEIKPNKKTFVAASEAQPAVSQPAAANPGPAWAETALIQPGKTALVDLLIHSAWIRQSEARPFQVKSRPDEKEHTPLVVEDNMVMIQGGFWSHRLYPKLVIALIALLALALVAWLAHAGILV